MIVKPSAGYSFREDRSMVGRYNPGNAGVRPGLQSAHQVYPKG